MKLVKTPPKDPHRLWSRHRPRVSPSEVSYLDGTKVDSVFFFQWCTRWARQPASKSYRKEREGVVRWTFDNSFSKFQKWVRNSAANSIDTCMTTITNLTPDLSITLLWTWTWNLRPGEEKVIGKRGLSLTSNLDLLRQHSGYGARWCWIGMDLVLTEILLVIWLRSGEEIEDGLLPLVARSGAESPTTCR